MNLTEVNIKIFTIVHGNFLHIFLYIYFEILILILITGIFMYCEHEFFYIISFLGLNVVITKGNIKKDIERGISLYYKNSEGMF